MSLEERKAIEKSNLLSLALNEGRGGALFFTCVDPLDTNTTFVVTEIKRDCSNMDASEAQSDDEECTEQTINDDPGQLALKADTY